MTRTDLICDHFNTNHKSFASYITNNFNLISDLGKFFQKVSSNNMRIFLSLVFFNCLKDKQVKDRLQKNHQIL